LGCSWAFLCGNIFISKSRSDLSLVGGGQGLAARPLDYLLLGQLRLDTITEIGPLGGGHKSLESEFLIAKLQRFAALGDILLLLGEFRHSLYRTRNSS